MGYWKNKDILSMRGVPREAIDEVIDEAARMDARANSRVLEGKLIATLFFEASTRTRLSFQTACRRLGGKVLSVSDSKSTSMEKGETLHDTIKLVAACADAIVIRHPKEGSARLAAETADIPVINAGDGANQHPTQALLDLFTVKQRFGKIDGLSFLFIGDLKYGRTVHSLCQALSNYDVELCFYSPPALRMPIALLGELREKTRVRELDTMDLSAADVVYATRIQRERFADPAEYAKYSYEINAESLKRMKPDAVLMHPFPRVGEINTDVDKDARALYFVQEANGVPVRMALLKQILIG